MILIVINDYERSPSRARRASSRILFISRASSSRTLGFFEVGFFTEVAGVEMVADVVLGVDVDDVDLGEVVVLGEVAVVALGEVVLVADEDEEEFKA